jgi:hypothetical protein
LREKSINNFTLTKLVCLQIGKKIYGVSPTGTSNEGVECNYFNFANTDIMRRMLSDIRTLEQKQLLYTVLCRASYSVGKNKQPVAEHLTACGAIVIDSNNITTSAPIIQQVILFCILYFLLS